MPQSPHVEKHFTASETVRDVVMPVVNLLRVDQKRWVDFLMRFELGIAGRF